MAKFKEVNTCPPPEATKKVNISVGVRNLGEKDFEKMLGKKNRKKKAKRYGDRRGQMFS